MTAGELTHRTMASGETPASGDSVASGESVAPGETVTSGETVWRSWSPEVLDGPLNTRQLLRLDEALRLADASTGLTFSVYIGDLEEPIREHAERLHGQLVDPDHSVLVAVSPNQRQLEIVTGSVARRRILDREAKLAALSMAAAFGGGDLGGGVIAGLAQLAEKAARTSS